MSREGRHSGRRSWSPADRRRRSRRRRRTGPGSSTSCSMPPTRPGTEPSSCRPPVTPVPRRSPTVAGRHRTHDGLVAPKAAGQRHGGAGCRADRGVPDRSPRGRDPPPAPAMRQLPRAANPPTRDPRAARGAPPCRTAANDSDDPGQGVANGPDAARATPTRNRTRSELGPGTTTSPTADSGRSTATEPAGPQGNANGAGSDNGQHQARHRTRQRSAERGRAERRAGASRTGGRGWRPPDGRGHDDGAVDAPTDHPGSWRRRGSRRRLVGRRLGRLTGRQPLAADPGSCRASG